MPEVGGRAFPYTKKGKAAAKKEAAKTGKPMELREHLMKYAKKGKK